jgi:hypothetical protein
MSKGGGLVEGVGGTAADVRAEMLRIHVQGLRHAAKVHRSRKVVLLPHLHRRTRGGGRGGVWSV